MGFRVEGLGLRVSGPKPETPPNPKPCNPLDNSVTRDSKRGSAKGSTLASPQLKPQGLGSRIYGSGFRV